MGITDDEITAAVPGLLRYARVLTRDPVAAEDLVQDTVVRALERAGDFRGDSSPATWLHRILHHRFVDVVRATRTEPVDADELAERVEADWRDDSYTVDAETVVLRAETAEDLRDAIIHLLYQLSLGGRPPRRPGPDRRRGGRGPRSQPGRRQAADQSGPRHARHPPRARHRTKGSVGRDPVALLGRSLAGE